MNPLLCQGRLTVFVLASLSSACQGAVRSVLLCQRHYKFKRNSKLIPTTEKGGLATPSWTDSKFKSLLGDHMDSIVTELVRVDLTKKFAIDPENVWTIE